MNADSTPHDCDLPNEGAALGLLALMRGISEGYWCAGWMVGLEFSCWRAATGKAPMRFGMGEISERQALLLRELANEADGWWFFDDQNGETFIGLGEWKKRVAEMEPGI